MTRTYLALLHYDGRDFVGWQRQASGRTVQAEFEGVMERLCGRRIACHAAGRTDAGVHALGMGVSFAAPPKWTADTLRRALNALLPRDCWVETVMPMKPGFHARKSAAGRRYRYDVGTDAGAFSPFRHPYEWALGRPLELAAMHRATSAILGQHSFAAFAARSAPKPHYRCRVVTAQWEPRDGGRGFRFHVAADRFLHHMVRFLVGTLVDIGLGRWPVEDMTSLLAREDNQGTSPPAPPQGLYFEAAEYAEEWYLPPLEVPA
jgi:tRNA pseudouridine38-40 synthase